jgi:hypothetical protein
VIRVFLSRKCLKSLDKPSPEQQARAEAVLREVMHTFGQPHRHTGTGLRKLSADYYECRLDLSLRIILQHRQDDLLGYDVMTHKEVQAFLKGL